MSADASAPIGVARSKRRDLALVLDVSLFLDSAIDHLTTVVNQVERGLLPRFSLYTIIRGALEADAWACWLLDPAISDDDRLARALTIRANSLFEMKRLGLSPAGTTPERHYSNRIKRVLATAKRWKLVAKTDNRGLVALVPLPKVTPLLRSLLADPSPQNKSLALGDQTYRELSARAHGTPWAMLRNVTATRRLNKVQQMGHSGLDVIEFVSLLGVVVSLHDEAMKRVEMLAGRNFGTWVALRGAVPW